MVYVDEANSIIALGNPYGFTARLSLLRTRSAKRTGVSVDCRPLSKGELFAPMTFLAHVTETCLRCGCQQVPLAVQPGDVKAIDNAVSTSGRLMKPWQQRVVKTLGTSTQPDYNKIERWFVPECGSDGMDLTNFFRGIASMPLSVLS